MSYHLNRNGESLGVFPLDELRRKRGAGELTGNELVWCQGMANWEPLDFVLRREKKERRRVPVWVIWLLAGGGAVMAAVTMGGILLVYKVKEQLAVWESEFSHAVVEGVELAGPVAVEPETRTVREVNELGRDFRRRHYLEGYERDGERGHACDADSVVFLQAWLAFHFGGEWPEMELSHWDLGRKVANSTCADPLVLAIASMHVAEPADYGRVLAPVQDDLMRSGHKPYPKFWITVVLGDEVRAKGRRDVLDASAVELFEQIFQGEDFGDSDQEILAENLVHGWGKSFFERKGMEVVSVVKNAGPEYEWLALVLEGEWHIIQAWRARGSGYANSVTEEGWRGFREHLAEARASLVPAWERHPEYPIAASRMIYVAMGESDPADMRVWFERALAAQVDYNAAWARMRWGLRPRWHGSHEAMLALGVAAVDTGRFDTDVPRKLFDVITDLESELSLPEGEHIYGREDIWPHLQRMYEGYLAEHAGLGSEDGWRSAYAGVAYFAGKYEVAREQLESLDWKPWPQSLAWWKVDLSLMPLEVAARTGSHADEVSVAEEAWKERDRAVATRLYRAISEDDPDERTREFVRRRLLVLER